MPDIIVTRAFHRSGHPPVREGQRITVSDGEARDLVRNRVALLAADDDMFRDPRPQPQDAQRAVPAAPANKMDNPPLDKAEIASPARKSRVRRRRTTDEGSFAED